MNTSDTTTTASAQPELLAGKELPSTKIVRAIINLRDAADIMTGNGAPFAKIDTLKETIRSLEQILN